MKLYLLLAFISMIGMYWQLRPVTESGNEPLPVNNPVYCSPSFDPSKIDGDAPLLEGLGNIKYEVTTNSAKAQLYFNQGLALTYGFNHSEAARSFKTAIRLDTGFAMAYWGLAMVLGPNYNAALNPSSLSTINEAIDNAVKHAGTTKPNEQALIAAMAKRFPRVETKDMTPYYEAYAAAMAVAHQQFPNDIDIATLYADALMNLHPWDLWAKDGAARPWTGKIMKLLEGTLKQSPDHPGAIHYYIHAIEASKQAEKAIPFADKLPTAMPAAGHLVHMPSHIYIRTGQYHKGVLVNEKASQGDSAYIAQCKAQGFYPLLLYPHNIHFLAACAFFEGNSKKAIDAAWMVSRKADRKFLAENITLQHFYVIPYYVMVHMGKWDDILQLQHPGENMKYPAAIWHYAKGMAYASKGKQDRALIELNAVKNFIEEGSLKKVLIWDMNTAEELLRIASNVLEGEILAHQGQYEKAFGLFRKAIEIEDNLLYNEPPDWFFSVRHTLGHWLVKAGRYNDAEIVYRKDLELFKENGWALAGLHNCLKGQGKKEEAQIVKKRFDEAWSHSDIMITSSRKF